MAEAYKVLGQVAPAAVTLTTLYTVPALTSSIVSSIVICNRAVTGASPTFRLSIAIGGAADAVEQYLYREVGLANSSTFTAVLGLTLAAGDVVRVQTSSANFSFNLFGTEIT